MFETPIAHRAADIYAFALPLAPPEMNLRQVYFGPSIKGLRSVRGPYYRPVTKSLWVGKHIPKSMTMSPNSIVLASLVEDGSSTILWDAATGEHRELLDHPGVDLQCVAFSPDGKTLASGSLGPDIHLWDIEIMLKKRNTLQVDSPMEWLAFSPNGQTLVSKSVMGSVCLWDLKDAANFTCTPWAELERRTEEEGGDDEGCHLKRVCPFAWSSDGRKLGYLCSKRRFLFWDVDGKAQIGEEWVSKTLVTAFALSSDGRIMAVGDMDEENIQLLHPEAGTQLGVLSRATSRVVTHLSFSANDRMIASHNSEEDIVLWELKNEAGWQATKLLTGYTDRLCDIAFSYGARIFAAAERTWDMDTKMRKEELVLTGHTSLVVCLAFSPDGRSLASGSIEGNICLWDAELGVQTGCIRSDHSGLPMDLRYTEDGRKLVVSHGIWEAGGVASASLPTGDMPSVQNSGVMECGEIDTRGWVLYGSEQWFWLPISGGGWLLHGTCLAVRTGFCVFIFDVSGVMDMVPKDKTR